MRGHRPPTQNLHVQPCWSCANAVPSVGTGCPWSERFEPVPGWVAQPRIIARRRGKSTPGKSKSAHSTSLGNLE